MTATNPLLESQTTQKVSQIVKCNVRVGRPLQYLGQYAINFAHYSILPSKRWPYKPITVESPPRG